MPTQQYKGLVLLTPPIPGAGGGAISDDLKSLVDWHPKSTWAENNAPNPSVDNATLNYHPGSLWLQTGASPPKLFVCQSSTTSTAVWLQVITDIKIVNDTAPKLGGNLDVNGKTITSTSGPVVVNPANGQVYFGATQYTQVRGGQLNIEKNAPAIVLYDTTPYAPAPPDPPVDQRGWDFMVSQSKLFFRLLNDAATAATIWLEVQRSGATPTMIRLTGPTRIAGTLYHNQTYCDNANVPDNNSSTTTTFNLAVSDMHATTMAGNRTLAVTNSQIGQRFNVTLTQGTGGPYTVTWWSGIKWPGGTVPTLTPTVGKSDVFEFLTKPSGEFIGRIWAQNL